VVLAYSPFTRRTDTKVRRYIEARNVLSRSERVVVGLSGGPDSTALLVVLSRLANRVDVHLTAAHFDHQLRSRAEAAADREFADSLCRELGVDLTCGAGDVKGRTRNKKESQEEAARNLRYAFLGEAAATVGASAIVVGHTLDDRAETVLMNLLRGAGTQGIAAMPPRSPWPFGDGPAIARPLLELRREDTARYCRESGVDPRIDPTNDLPVATRNRVRGELMPLLRTFNPRIEEALARLADSMALDADALSGAATAEWESVGRRQGQAIRFDRAAFTGLPGAIAARLVQRAARELHGESPSARQTESVLGAAVGPPAEVSLPGGLIAVSDRRWLTIRRNPDGGSAP
jgi:tRNA(Ile)-lysidine synthase